MKRTPDIDSGLQTLVQRVDMAMDKAEGRIITFISARPGEGTSTVARDYAWALADSVDHKILLIDAGKIDHEFYEKYDADPKVAIADAVTAGKALDDVLYPLGDHIHVGRWSSLKRGRSAAAKLLKDDAFWKKLHKSFGTVIIDAPSLTDSSDGIALAAHADATVIVVEAETTRQPVIENLRDTLQMAGAKILGMVMNKRRYYIPANVYRNM